MSLAERTWVWQLANQSSTTHKRLKDTLCGVSAWAYLNSQEVILGKEKGHVQKASPALLHKTLFASLCLIYSSLVLRIKITVPPKNNNTKCIISKV